MKNKALLLKQLDKKMTSFGHVEAALPSSEGWIHAIRTALGMSLKQLGKRLSITPQSVKEIETRELSQSLTIRSLHEVAEALDMKLVYGFVPNDGSLEKLVERHAYKVAQKIVARTSQSMMLEDQGPTSERLGEAIQEMTERLKKEIPRHLWD